VAGKGDDVTMRPRLQKPGIGQYHAEEGGRMNSSIEKKACRAGYDRRTGAAEVSKSRRIDYVVCGVIEFR
jgi:hypothetical protein